MHKWKWVLIVLISVLCLILFLWLFWPVKILKRQDENNETIEYNPLTGFAVSADYEDAVAQNQLVYVEILWSKIEPEEGKFDFSGILELNKIEQWKSQGKHAVIRFVCDKPGEEKHMDIPQWLYDKTGGNGDFYDTDYGMGYAPDYSDETFLACHEKAIQAIAREFSKDGFAAYVQLGSIGHWGEWHVKYDQGIRRLPDERTCKRYAEQYREAFPDTCLLMRRPFLEVSMYGLGVYNDMTGDPEATGIWLDWLKDGGVYDEPAGKHVLYGVPEFWNQGAVGGEFTSGLSWEEMLGKDFSRTKSLIQDSHMTFIGPMCPHEETAGEYQNQAGEIRSMLGYRIGISDLSAVYQKWSKNWSIRLTWNNKGLAPMYYDWPVYMYQMNEKGSIIGKLPVDLKLRELLPGTEQITKTKFRAALSDVAYLGIGIEDPMTGQPAVLLNNGWNRNGKISLLLSADDMD